MPQISALQLSPHLQAVGGKAFVVMGEDPHFFNQASDAIRQASRVQGFDDALRFEAATDEAWEAFSTHCRQPSLFTSQQRLELRSEQSSLSATAKTVLAECVAIQNPDQVMLILLPRLDKKTSKAAWFREVLANAHVVSATPLSAKQQAQWVEKTLTARGLHLDAEALQYLVQQSEGNLAAAMQAIERLEYGLAPTTPQPLSLPAIQAFVTDSAQYDIFNLSDACLQGDLNRSLDILTRLQQLGVTPLLILWALAREARILYQLQLEQQQGRALAPAFERLKVWSSRRPLLTQCLARSFAAATLLTQLKHVDALIKGEAPGDPWLALAQVVMYFNQPHWQLGVR